MAMLKSRGYTTVAAYDAMSGFTAAIRERPALLVVDLSMPAGGGFSILERMKTFPALASTPAIVITSQDEVPIRERASALGAIAFLVKPVKADELLNIVAATLSQP